MRRRKKIRSRQEIKISGNNRGGERMKSKVRTIPLWIKKKRKLKKGTGSKMIKGKKEMEVLNRKAKNLGRFKV